MSRWEKKLEKLILGHRINVKLDELKWLERQGFILDDYLQASTSGYYVSLKKEIGGK